MSKLIALLPSRSNANCSTITFIMYFNVNKSQFSFSVQKYLVNTPDVLRSNPGKNIKRNDDKVNPFSEVLKVG